jgi:hypothetical protein
MNVIHFYVFVGMVEPSDIDKPNIAKPDVVEPMIT